MVKKMKTYAQQCYVFQRTKVDNIKKRGILQPIPLSAISWTNIALDFLVDLPISNGFVTILVIIDRFSKILHLVPLKESLSAEDIAAVFFKNIDRQYSLLSSIIFNHDPCFQAILWKALIEVHMGSKLLFS